MNYFEFYNIPVAFKINSEDITRKFYQLSKQYHPDFYINEGLTKQAEILELSTFNNKSYQTLSNPQKRLEYILQLYNMLQEGEKYTLPQDFLMEMMEVNEALMEMELDPNPSTLQELGLKINDIERKLFDELEVLANQFDRGSEEERKQLLVKVKDSYYRQKYLLRIHESLNRFASRI